LFYSEIRHLKITSKGNNMRTEQLTAIALEKVDFDKYLLANAVGKRAESIANGAEVLLDMDTSGMKYSDIALQEIAEGKITVSLEG
jgi:DNA-directed RNA polymerase subunit omega